jgi:hypothetical protein
MVFFDNSYLDNISVDKYLTDVIDNSLLDKYLTDTKLLDNSVNKFDDIKYYKNYINTTYQPTTRNNDMIKVSQYDITKNKSHNNDELFSPLYIKLLDEVFIQNFYNIGDVVEVGKLTGVYIGDSTLDDCIILRVNKIPQFESLYSAVGPYEISVILPDSEELKNCVLDNDLLEVKSNDNVVETETKKDEPQNKLVKQKPDRTVKQNAKKLAKNCIKTKWVIGGIYVQKIKPRNGSKPLIWEYELIKYVYTIKDYQMNSLIVKKISGPEERIFSLSPYDCKRLHIKFQQGLQIISMNTKNLRLKKTNKK